MHTLGEVGPGGLCGSDPGAETRMEGRRCHLESWEESDPDRKCSRSPGVEVGGADTDLSHVVPWP